MPWEADTANYDILRGMRRCRENLPNRCCHLTSRVVRRAFEGVQAANRNGRAAMTMDDYCGNLLWQSGLTLFAPRIFDILHGTWKRMDISNNEHG